MKQEKFTTRDLSVEEAQRLMHLVGVADEHLRAIEKLCELQIQRRGSHIRVIGASSAQVALAEKILQTLINQSQMPIAPAQILAVFHESKMALNTPSLSKKSKGAVGKTASKGVSARSLTPTPKPSQATSSKVLADSSDTESFLTINASRRQIRPRTANQIAYLQGIDNHDLVIGIGPAGTGKTYLAVAMAVNAWEQGRVQRIILTRPAVEAGEKLGFLPGSLAEKVDPYLRPVYDALFDMLGAEKFRRLQERGDIEIAPLAFMRGRTLHEAFVILDEAQNTTPEQMKMFLTRMGYGSKVVVNGDLTQTDLPMGKTSGLAQAVELLRKIKAVKLVFFDRHDVVRHPLVAQIIQAYESPE